MDNDVVFPHGEEMELDRIVATFKDYLSIAGISSQSLAAYTTPFKRIVDTYMKENHIFDISIEDVEKAIDRFIEDEKFREKVKGNRNYNWKKVIEYAIGFINHYKELTFLSKKEGDWIIRCTKIFAEPIYVKDWEESKTGAFIRIKTVEGKEFFINSSIVLYIKRNDE